MHIPKNIPILDEEYMKRRKREIYTEARNASRRRVNHLSIIYTEEQDKQSFIEGKITEEELAERTEARWHKEMVEAKYQMQQQQKLLIRENKIAPSTRKFLEESKTNLIIVILSAWMAATILEGVGGKVLAAYVGYPVGFVALLLVWWINRILKRR